MATKFVYTDSEITEITAKYLAGIALEELAEAYNKSVPSVRMKLVKLGVYVAKGKTSAAAKTSGVSVTKPTVKAATKAEISKTFRDELAVVGPALF